MLTFREQFEKWYIENFGPSNFSIVSARDDIKEHYLYRSVEHAYQAYLKIVPQWIRLTHIGPAPISEPVLLASPYWDFPLQGTLIYRADDKDDFLANVYGTEDAVTVTHYQSLPSLPKA